ncbi:MAG: CmcI family methyltransferase [Thermomicrobiales bacterium]
MIDADNPVVREFHRLYYDARGQTWENTFWFGTPVLKCPLDLWIYQEIIHETRPDLIIETGTMEGGSARFMAALLDWIGHGEIVSIDIEAKSWRPVHPRITYLTGSSTDPGIIDEIAARAAGKPAVMVILDSDHRAPHVLDELRLLSPFVTPGGYLIVEDTNVNGHPVVPDFGPGPLEALDQFLSESSDFTVDRGREKLLMTFNPRGFLKRQAEGPTGGRRRQLSAITPPRGERIADRARRAPGAAARQEPRRSPSNPSDGGAETDTAATIAWRDPHGGGGSVTLRPGSAPDVQVHVEKEAATGWLREGEPGEFRLALSVTAATPAAAPPNSAAELYLDLMKKCLTRIVFKESGPPILPGFGPFDPAAREEGRDWPADAESMAGRFRLDNVQMCVTDVLRNGVPGDLIETGVWRGGTTIFMRAILAAYGDRERRVWVADSFQGLPRPDVEHYPQDAGLDLWQYEQLAIPVEQVQANFARYDLLDDQVRFLKGWFRDTLPAAPIDQLAVLRLDGDLYESTMDALRALYPKLSVGGYAIIDDFGGIPACAAAVHDYRAEHGIEEPIVPIDWTGVYWRRER